VVEDTGAFEQEVLSKTRESLSSSEHFLHRLGRQVVEVRLDGSYPDTDLIVEYTENEAHLEKKWPIWDPSIQPSSMNVAPDSIAALVFSNMTET
jgi:hypothetical protein